MGDLIIEYEFFTAATSHEEAARLGPPIRFCDISWASDGCAATEEYRPRTSYK
jgi:hypothetical protein